MRLGEKRKRKREKERAVVSPENGIPSKSFIKLVSPQLFNLPRYDTLAQSKASGGRFPFMRIR